MIKSKENIPSLRSSLEVQAKHAGQRIDNYLLRELKGVPRGLVYRLVRKGAVRVNGVKVDAHYKLLAGDQIVLPTLRTAAVKAPFQASLRHQELLAQAILYENEQLVVLNKPAGWAVHSGTGQSHGVIDLARAYYGNPDLQLVHRLDKETSGCLVLAKESQALKLLLEQFSQGVAQKTYLALVKGRWSLGIKSVDTLLAKNPQKINGKMAVAEQGKLAQSIFKPQAYFDDNTLMQINLLTGRTHQIRVQASHLGFPVAGDDRYGDWEHNKHLRLLSLKRLFLHAQSLKIFLPGAAAWIEIQAPLPEDLNGVLSQLQRNFSRDV